MGLPCSSSNYSKSIYVSSFEKVNKNSLISYQINEHNLVSEIFKTMYIKFIYHLKGGSMKKSNIHLIWVTIYIFKGLCLWLSNSLLRWYNQFGNLALSFALFWSLKKNLNYQIFCMVTYVTGCYSSTLPLSKG